MRRDEDAIARVMTADELERLDVPGKTTELVRGRLMVREPPGARHGSVAARLTYLIADFVYRNRLGAVFAQDTGFRIASNPDTVRAPDVAFVARNPTRAIPARGYAPFAPDLAVEIRSPDDTTSYLADKAADWLAAGTELVWVVDPDREEGWVYRRDGTTTTVPPNGAFDGERVLPGFSCALADVLS